MLPDPPYCVIALHDEKQAVERKYQRMGAYTCNDVEQALTDIAVFLIVHEGYNISLHFQDVCTYLQCLYNTSNKQLTSCYT